jgi:hypothetical protein
MSLRAEIEVVRGPLPSASVQRIAELYGPVDVRYRDVEFLERQFVSNPLGWALHAFVRAGGRYLGHCAVIPVPGLCGATPIITGKVEALAIKEEARSASILGAPAQPAILSLLTGLYARAYSEGIEVIHAMGSDTLGVFHRMAGLQAIRWKERHYWTGGDPNVLASRIKNNQLRGLIRVALGTANAVHRGLACLGGQTGRLQEQVSMQWQLGIKLGRTEWSVLPAEIVRWHADSGVLGELLVKSGRSHARLLLAMPREPSGPAEIVGWDPESLSPTAAVASLLGAIRFSALSNTRVMLRTPLSFVGGDLLHAAARRLLLPQRVTNGSLYVGVKLGSPVDPLRVQLSPFFHCTF